MRLTGRNTQLLLASLHLKAMNLRTPLAARRSWWQMSVLPMWHHVVHCSIFRTDAGILADRHKGQLALRKLYHESDRLLVVLYTSPTCGPCRTLKPIFSKVVDDYPGKVSNVSDVHAL